MLVPVGIPQAEPIHRAARRAVPFEVGKHSLRVAVLEGVESALFASLEQFHDSFRRVPGGHVAVEVLVEVRVTVNGIAPDDQPSDSMRTQLNGRQKRGRRGRPVSGLNGVGQRSNCGSDPRSLVQEIPATGSRTVAISETIR